MRGHALVGVAVVLALGASAGPARAQSFVPSTTRTVPMGDFRLSGYPVGLLGRNGNPDRLGGGWRFGYGITDDLDLQANAAFFDRFTVLGLDSSFRLVRGPLDLTLILGGHRTLIRSARDSTALDGAWLLGTRVSSRLRLVAGMAGSVERIDGDQDSTFSRLYLVPGLDYRITDRVALVSQVGLGLNDDSPSYVRAGLSVYLPAPGSGGGVREWY